LRSGRAEAPGPGHVAGTECWPITSRKGRARSETAYVQRCLDHRRECCHEQGPDGQRDCRRSNNPRKLTAGQNMPHDARINAPHPSPASPHPVDRRQIDETDVVTPCGLLHQRGRETVHRSSTPRRRTVALASPSSAIRVPEVCALRPGARATTSSSCLARPAESWRSAEPTAPTGTPISLSANRRTRHRSTGALGCPAGQDVRGSGQDLLPVVPWGSYSWRTTDL
jgi:hypothetical protein